MGYVITIQNPEEYLKLASCHIRSVHTVLSSKMVTKLILALLSFYALMGSVLGKPHHQENWFGDNKHQVLDSEDIWIDDQKLEEQNMNLEREKHDSENQRITRRQAHDHEHEDHDEDEEHDHEHEEHHNDEEHKQDHGHQRITKRQAHDHEHEDHDEDHDEDHEEHHNDEEHKHDHEHKRIMRREENDHDHENHDQDHQHDFHSNMNKRSFRCSPRCTERREACSRTQKTYENPCALACAGERLSHFGPCSGIRKN